MHAINAALSKAVRSHRGYQGMHDVYHPMIEKRLRQLKMEPVPKMTPAMKREVNELGCSTDADLIHRILRGASSRYSSIRLGSSRSSLLAWTGEYGPAESAKLAGLYAKLYPIADMCCGRRTSFIAPREDGYYRMECSIVKPYCSDDEDEGAPAVLAIGGYQDKHGGAIGITAAGKLKRVHYSSDAVSQQDTVSILLNWVDNHDPEALRRCCSGLRMCGVCGDHLRTPEERAAGFGKRCADLAKLLMAPVTPVTTSPSLESAWTVVKEKSTVLTDDDGLDLQTGALPKRVLSACAELTQGKPLDEVVALLAAGLTDGWRDTFVAPDWIVPVVLVADYLDVECASLMIIANSHATYDVRHLIVASAELV